MLPSLHFTTVTSSEFSDLTLSHSHLSNSHSLTIHTLWKNDDTKNFLENIVKKANSHTQTLYVYGSVKLERTPWSGKLRWTTLNQLQFTATAWSAIESNLLVVITNNDPYMRCNSSNALWLSRVHKIYIRTVCS